MAAPGSEGRRVVGGVHHRRGRRSVAGGGYARPPQEPLPPAGIVVGPALVRQGPRPLGRPGPGERLEDPLGQGRVVDAGAGADSRSDPGSVAGPAIRRGAWRGGGGGPRRRGSRARSGRPARGRPCGRGRPCERGAGSRARRSAGRGPGPSGRPRRAGVGVRDRRPGPGAGAPSARGDLGEPLLELGEQRSPGSVLARIQGGQQRRRDLELDDGGARLVPGACGTGRGGGVVGGRAERAGGGRRRR